MPYNCLVIDDNYIKSQELKRLLDVQPLVNNVLNTVHPYQINSYLMNEAIDVVFIRVKLWEHRLFTIVHALKKKPMVVFITSVTDKYRTDELGDMQDVLREPFDGKAIHGLLKKLLNKPLYEQNWNFLFVKYERQYHRILFEDVELVENKPNSCYVQLHTKRGKYVIKDTIQNILERLPEDCFQRISDDLIIPFENRQLINNDCYPFEGKLFTLTYRFVKQLEKKEAEELNIIH